MADLRDRFKVRGQDGTIHDVLVFQKRIPNTTMDRGKSFIYGLKELRLTDGRALNVVDDDTFVIVGTGERVTRVK